MRYVLLLSASILSLFSASAQGQFTLLMDTRPIGSVLKLSKYQGDLEIPLDSMRYRGESQVVFHYDDRYTDGVYLLEVSNLEDFQFVSVGQEDLKAHIYESGSGMAFKADGSKENDAFNIMLNLSDVYSLNMDSVSYALNHLSDFAPRYKTVSDSLGGIYHQVAAAYNNSLGLLIDLFPDSYTSQVLVQLDKIPLRKDKAEWDKMYDNDAAFNHVHYFTYIDFSDERIITNPFLTNKVLEYLYNYTEHSELGIKKTIDLLLKRPDLHPKVQGFLIELLVDFFTDKEASQFVDYINREYLGNCELPLSDELLKRIASVVRFNAGDRIPDVEIPGIDGRTIPLSAVSSKWSVMVFWASWCEHCEREIPKLQTLYDQMKGDLGVYAVSVDTSKVDWMNAVEKNKMKWVNVNDLKGWESEHLFTFGITSTPTFILLDADQRWIGRTGSFDGLHELVRKQLAP